MDEKEEKEVNDKERKERWVGKVRDTRAKNKKEKTKGLSTHRCMYSLPGLSVACVLWTDCEGKKKKEKK